jgi:hypothetical protein
VPHQNFDAVSAVYVANLLAHELEQAGQPEGAVFRMEDYQEELGELGIAGLLPEWQRMAKEIPPAVMEA